jgi:hypothetical protein
MNRTRIASAALAAMAALALLTTPALAASPDRAFAPVPDEFVLDDVCPFPLVLRILVNREYAITFVDRAGEPTRMLVTGRLVVEAVRTDTGTSVVINASGPGAIDLVTGDFIGYGAYLQWGPGIDGLTLYRGHHDPTGVGTGLATNLCGLLG